MTVSRRRFMRDASFAALLFSSAPLAAAASTSIKIAEIKTFPIIYPTVGRFKFFEGGPKGRPPGRPSVLVKIIADNGVVGWGQSVPIPKWSYETIETVNS